MLVKFVDISIDKENNGDIEEEEHSLYIPMMGITPDIRVNRNKNGYFYKTVERPIECEEVEMNANDDESSSMYSETSHDSSNYESDIDDECMEIEQHISNDRCMSTGVYDNVNKDNLLMDDNNSDIHSTCTDGNNSDENNSSCDDDCESDSNILTIGDNEPVSNDIVKHALKNYMRGIPLMFSEFSIRDSPHSTHNNNP